MAKRTPLRDPEARANDVLSGRADPAAGELIELIRQVNPTPRSLPRAVEERRYQVKNRLQSLLIRRYPEDIAVEPGADGSPDVGLRHRYLGLDACHARVDALDDDARSWVRLQLDLGIAAIEEEARAIGGDARVDDSPAGLVRLGREAMADYDYDAAESLLREALTRSNGAAFAADALFQLFVDTLALDDKAISLADELSASALKQPSLRAALALACARCGRLDESVSWLEGARGSRAADALACLAHEALRREDFPQVTRWLEALRAEDPAHVEAVAIGVLLDKRQAELERPLIEARRREREAQELARREELEQVIAEAQTADDAVALRLYERAQELGGEVAEPLARVRERLAEKERFERIARSVELLETPALETSALVAYGALEAAERASVRELLATDAAAHRLVAWMEEMTFEGSGAKVRAAADAALALADAFEADDAHAALATMQPHSRLLSHVADAHRLDAQLHSTLKAQAQEAQRIAEMARLEEERVQREVRRVQEKSERASRALHAASAGDTLQAQHEARLVRRLADSDAERAQWDERLSEWGRATATEWEWTEVHGAAADGSLPEARNLMSAGRMSSHCLTTGGRSWVVVCVFGDHLFAVEVALDTRRIVRRVRLRLPEQTTVSKVLFREESLWLLGREGKLLELAWTRGEVRRWVNLARLPGVGAAYTGEFIVPRGTPLVWVLNEADHETGMRVIDPDALRVVWRDNDETRPQALDLATGTVVVRPHPHGPADLRDVEGRRLIPSNWPRDRRVHEIVVHPDGERFVALLADPEPTAPLLLTEWSEQHAPRHRPVEVTTAGHSMLEMSHDEGLVFLLQYPDAKSPGHIAALRPGPEGLQEAYRVAIPDSATTMIVDEASRRVVLVDYQEALRLEPLGTQPPPTHARPPRPVFNLEFPALTPPFDCYAPPNDLRLLKPDAIDEIIASLPNMKSLAKQVKRAAEKGDDREPDAEDHRLAEEVQRTTRAFTQNDASLAFRLAHQQLEKEEWPEISALMEAVDERHLPDKAFDHRCHLLGLARWHQGDLGGALQHWRAGKQSHDPCRLQAAIRYTEAMLDEDMRKRGRDLPTRTLAALFDVDLALADNDFERAWSVLQTLDSFVLQDVQIAARHATVAMERDPQDERERHGIALSLSRFLFSYTDPSHPHELLTRMFHLGPKHWNKPTLDQLADRARAWLDAARLATNTRVA